MPSITMIRPLARNIQYIEVESFQGGFFGGGAVEGE